MSKTLQITIGAMEPKLSKQLAGFISAYDGDLLDFDSDAITRCSLRGLISDAETKLARQRLLKLVRKAVARHRSQSSVPSVTPQ